MSLPKELKEALDVELDDEYIAKEEESCHSYDELMKSIQYDENEDSLPGDYGGCFIDSNGELNVLVASKENSVKNQYKTRISNDNIKIKEAKYSKNYLNGFMNVINAYLLQHTDSQIKEEIDSVYLLENENKIVVELNELNEDKVNMFKNQIGDSEAIDFINSSGRATDTQTVTAGYSLSNSSVGYRARRGGKNGIVIAGHATSNNATVRSSNGVAFARTEVRRYSGSVDAAWCSITNSNYVPSNTIARSRGFTLSTFVSVPPVGTTLIKSGKTSGLTAGNIVSTNASMIVNGITFTNLISAVITNQPGDSGGIAFYNTGSSRPTVGIVKGNQGNQSYFVKAGQINSAFGLSRYWKIKKFCILCSPFS